MSTHKRNVGFMIIFAILILVGGGMLMGQQRKPTADVQKTDAQSVKGAPDFSLPDLEGKPFRFSDLKGKVVILDFWATWCPPCKAEIPHFKSLYKQYQKEGLEVIGIALDRGGAGDVRPFVEDNEINYPILIGDQKVTEAYGGIRGIPTTFIIDRQGRIVEKFVGYRDKETFESAIQGLL